MPDQEPIFPDLSKGFATLTAALQNIDLWLFVAFAAIGLALLYAPDFGGVDASALRRKYGIWMWAWTWVFVCLSAVRAADLIVKHLRRTQQRKAERRESQFVPSPHTCFWDLSTWDDGTVVSDVIVDGMVNNSSARVLVIAAVRIESAKFSVLKRFSILKQAVAIKLAENGRPEMDRSLPPRRNGKLAMQLTVIGALGRKGDAARVRVVFTDQRGEDYRCRLYLAPM